MSAPDQQNEPQIELTLTDHFLQALKAALEFNTNIIEIATQVVAMDSSGHNKTLVRKVHEDFKNSNRRYAKQIDEINRRIVEQYLPSIQEKASDEDPTKEA